MNISNSISIVLLALAIISNSVADKEQGNKIKALQEQVEQLEEKQ